MILLARSFRKTGPSMGLGQVMSLGGMPFHYVKDRYGDQVALPCTERNLTQTRTQAAVARGLMPVVSVKGRDEVRLASFQSLAGSIVLGRWTDVPPPKPKEPPPRVEAEEDTASEDMDLSDADDGASDAMDDDLAALLAGFDTETPDDSEDNASDDDAEMDAELAALLASL